MRSFSELIVGSAFETSERFKCTDNAESGLEIVKLIFIEQGPQTQMPTGDQKKLFKCSPGDYGNW